RRIVDLARWRLGTAEPRRATADLDCRIEWFRQDNFSGEACSAPQETGTQSKLGRAGFAKTGCDRTTRDARETNRRSRFYSRPKRNKCSARGRSCIARSIRLRRGYGGTSNL